MLISTKGRYALRVMIDLAEHYSEEYITLNTIAERQNISEKYLESIITVLSKKGLVDALRGKGGGYRLNRAPEDYTAGEILESVEGKVSAVSCLKEEKNFCHRAGECSTLSMWTQLNNVINEYLNGVTLLSLVSETPGNDFVI